MAIKITEQIIQEVQNTGESISKVLEKAYEGELADKRKANEYLKNMSATKIAMLDAGIDGSSRVDKLFTTSDNEFLFPAFLADIVDSTMSQSDVLKYMVSGETGIDNLVFKAPTLDLLSSANKDNIKKSRVSEGADIPEKSVTIGQKSVELWKKAVALRLSYESLRYQRIDIASRMLRAIANDIVGQNIDDITDTLETGTLTALKTTATANTVTADELFEACITYVMRFGYAPTTILADEDLYKSIAKITYNTNNEFGANSKLSIDVPQLGNMKLALIKAPVSKVSNKNVALIYNKDLSIQRFVANGSNLNEIQQNILNQTRLVTMSEISGYGKLVDSVGKITSA